MSDGPSKLAKPGAMPLDEIILGEDDAAAVRPTQAASLVPPSAATGSIRPKSKPMPSVRPASVAPPPSRDGGDVTAKRAKLTLRIPDDEISRPSLPPVETPAGGVAAVSTLSRRPPRPSSPDDTLEIPPEQVRARLAALGVEPAPGVDTGNERGWTPYQPAVDGAGAPGAKVDDLDSGRATLVDLNAPFTYPSDEMRPSDVIGPPSEEIPVDTDDDDDVTRPRLPVSRDSEEIKVEEGDRVSDAGGDEVTVEDVVSVESIPMPAHPPPPPRAPAAARSSPGVPESVPGSMPDTPRVETPRAAVESGPKPTPRPVNASIPPATTPTGGPAARRVPSSPGLSPIASALAPPPMNEAAANRKKTRPWWEDLFGDDFIRTMAKVTDAQIAREVDFIEESLGCEAGAMILDLACGTGRHAVDMATRGYQVVGYDLSLAMLARASDEAQDRKQKINFIQGDMRDMTFDETFDGVFSWNTSFGYFDEEKNAQVIAKVHRALKKGGQFLLDVVNRDNVIKQSPSLAWYEGDGCICMDEMSVDFITSRMKVKRTLMLDDGRSREIEYSIRIYSLHELGKLLHDNGFRVAEVSGRSSTPGVFFGCESPRTLILAEKR